MTTNTNFNTAPYFDDFNENKNFHRVLFRPSVPVQARELTQSQSIMQNQIARFGKHVFVEGSVVEGCAPSFDNRYNYIKVTDNYGNGVNINVSDLVGKTLLANTGIRAVVVNAIDGLEPQAPDLKTLYVKYLSTGRYANGDSQSRFDANTVLTIQSVNADDSTVDEGTLSIDGANTAGAVGVGYAVSIADGVIFQKGFFIRVEPQTIVISKYNNYPHLVSIGFETRETIVTPEADESLLDNALGTPNYTAPGAHRLKLTPVLTYRPTSQNSNSIGFFSIADFTFGNPTSIKTDSEYSKLGIELARRTYEESGDYLIDPFIVTSRGYSDFPGVLSLDVDAGEGYVKGYRVQQLGRRSVDVRKGTDIKYVDNAVITASMGNYVVANEVVGGWNFTNLGTVSLSNSAVLAVSNSANTANLLSFVAPVSNTIGTATIKAIEYENNIPGQPDHRVRLFLTNIKMDTGQSFQNVKSVYANGAGSLRSVADVVLNGGKAELQETNLDTLVFPMGKSALREFKNSSNATVTQFEFRQAATLTVNTTGGTTLTHSIAAPGGTETLTFGTGQISDPAVRANFLFVANSGADCVNVGTVAVTGANVVGTDTAFLTQYPGNTGYVKVFQSANASQTEVKLVVSVVNNTFLSVSTPFTHSHAAGNATCRTVPAGSIINPASINVISTTSATINALSNNSPTTFSMTAYYPVKRTNALPKLKTINKNRYVKIDGSGLTNNDIKTKSLYLGMPDVVSVRNIWVGNSTNQSNTNRNVTADFIFDSGQKDDYYGLASIRLKPGASLTLSNVATENSGLLVEFDHFTHSEASGAGFLTIESYPINDVDIANTATITTQEIPIFSSPTDGSQTDLRNAIDFRPIAANTIVSSTTIAGATIISNAVDIISPVVVFAPNAYGPLLPRTDTNIAGAFSFYLGRKVKVTIDPQGVLSVINGVAADFPISPRDVDGALTIASVNLPPYPTLSQADARRYGRPDYSITIEMQKNRRYTMRDIGAIAERVDRLEYYTSLSLLEKSASDLLITDDGGIERFKNGFLVEPFRGFDISDTRNAEFRIAIDKVNTEARPRIARKTMDLHFRSSLSNNMVKRGSVVSLPHFHTPYIDQPFVTKARNCVEGLIFEWKGNIELSPEGDYAVDENRNADVVINLDLASNWVEIADAWPTSWGDWTTTATTSSQTSSTTKIDNNESGSAGRKLITIQTEDGPKDIWQSTSSSGSQGIIQENTTSTQSSTQTRIGTSISASVNQNSYYAGEYITDISIQPYIRRRAVKFRATSLRPNSILTPFFDDVNVSDSVYPIPSLAPSSNLRSLSSLELNLQRPGQQAKTISQGQQLVSDQYGVAYGIFYIPDGVFRTGTRIFKLIDVTSLADSDSIQTIATATYTGSNYSITKSKLNLNTREPQIAQTVVSEQKVITTSTTRTNETVVTTNPAEANRNKEESEERKTYSPSAPNNPAPTAWPETNAQILAWNYAHPDKQLPYNRTDKITYNPFEPGVIPVLTPVYDVASGTWVPLNQGSRDACLNDPIAQTFLINEAPDDVGVFISRIDLFFQTKDPTYGIEVQLREVNNGFPTSSIVPFSRVLKTSAEVNISSRGTTATVFEFENPIFLKSGREYAVVVIPVGNSNKYNIWCSELGGIDRITGAQVSKNLDSGVLLVSSTNRIWSPYQKEDLKFKLYRAEFTSVESNAEIYSSLSGNAVYTNGELEYFTYNKSGLLGDFIPGERIYQSNGAALSSNGNTVSTSTTVYVGPGGPNAQTTFATGNKIFLANTLTSQIKTVNAVINSTAFTLTTNADITAADSLLIGKLRGDGNLYSTVLTLLPTQQTLQTTNSTANVTVYYTNNALIFGDTSGVYANVVSIDDFEYSIIVPQMADLTVTGTKFEWYFQGYSNNGILDEEFAITEGVETENTDYMRKILSCSNEMVAGGNKSLTLTAVARSTSSKITPIIDDIKNNVILIKNLINTQANTIDETSTNGNALSKYISKQVVLADGMDAEDFKVYIAAYQPQGTNLQVYGKFLHREDPDSFIEKSWTLLERETPPSVYSATSNKNDIREFAYKVPSTNAIATSAYIDPIDGITYYNKDGVLFTGYKTFAVKIVFQSDVGPHIVPRVSDMRAIALQL